jgi:transcription elongation factor Elf1
MTIMTFLFDTQIDDKYLKQARMVMDAMEREYQDKHPCPNCGSRNVHIEIDGIGGNCVSGTEWCDECGWRHDTNTFPHTK